MVNPRLASFMSESSEYCNFHPTSSCFPFGPDIFFFPPSVGHAELSLFSCFLFDLLCLAFLGPSFIAESSHFDILLFFLLHVALGESQINPRPLTVTVVLWFLLLSYHHSFFLLSITVLSVSCFSLTILFSYFLHETHQACWESVLSSSLCTTTY